MAIVENIVRTLKALFKFFISCVSVSNVLYSISLSLSFLTYYENPSNYYSPIALGRKPLGSTKRSKLLMVLSRFLLPNHLEKNQCREAFSTLDGEKKL